MIKVLNVAAIAVRAATASAQAAAKVIFTEDTAQKVAEAYHEVKKAVDASDIRGAVGEFMDVGDDLDEKVDAFKKDVKKKALRSWVTGQS